jgi:hypothetical protein
LFEKEIPGKSSFTSLVVNALKKGQTVDDKKILE